MLFERVEQGNWDVDWLGKGAVRQEVKEGFLEAAGVARETGLIPPLSLKPSRKFGLCFLSLAKSGDHWKLPEGRLLALLASEQRLLPLLPHPCARSLALPTRMGSPSQAPLCRAPVCFC